MKKNINITLITITSLVIVALFAVPSLTEAKVKAQDTTEATSAAETTQLLRDRIKKIVEEKKDQIQGAIDEISIQKRGFIGEVQRVTEEAITVKNRKGTQIVPINDEAIILKQGKKIEVGSIAVGDWLVVIGTIEDDQFVARRIIVSGLSLRPRTQVVALGSITSLTKKEIKILTRQNEELTLTIDKKTEFQDQDGETADIDLFTKDTQVLVTGYEDDKGKTATIVRAVVSLEAMQENE